MNISYVMLSTIIDHEMEIACNKIAGNEERIEGVWLKLVTYAKKKKSFFLGGS